MSKKHPYLTAPPPTSQMPGGIPYIVGNEAAERFSFYGMKGILVVFMWKYLHLMDAQIGAQMSNAEATYRYHLFTAWVYFTPFLGALLSDTLFGKYRTILWLSIVYCLGHASLALMGLVDVLSPAGWLLAGLVLIAVGSGGIKPCVSAHVGDQFGRSNKHLLSRVFGYFYFSINLGAFTSTILTPKLLEWYGPHVAFGVPGVLMAIATLLFWMGRHKFVHVPPGGSHFLRETFSLEGLLCLLKLAVIFIFIAVFWALFDQTGSTWVIQAEDLDRNLFGYELLPSQIQAANPILILTLVPIFNLVIYPRVDRVWKTTPLRRIAVGLFVMIAGFAIVAWLQEQIELGAQPSVAWQLLAYGLLTTSEVMVSITGLEFAYTQSPRTMKSFVMALFLFSVTLGNVFTAGVSHFIQTTDQLAAVHSAHRGWTTGQAPEEVPEEDRVASVAESTDVYGNAIVYEAFEDKHLYLLVGKDGEPGTDDDIRVTYTSDGQKDTVETPEDSLLEAASEPVQAHFDANDDQLPLTEHGAELIADHVDTHGNPLTYRLISRDRFRIVSNGPDGEYLTDDDVVLNGKVTRVDPKQVGKDKPYNWRERRIIELLGEEKGRQQVLKDRGDVKETKIDTETAVGGLVKLEGAGYFWFWTQMMAATAVLFLPVAWLYKPREYLQEEAPPEEEIEAEAER